MSDFDVLLFFTFCIIFHFVYAGFLCSGNVLILDESHLVWSFHCSVLAGNLSVSCDFPPRVKVQQTVNQMNGKHYLVLKSRTF